MSSPRPSTFDSAFRVYRNLGQIGCGGSGTVVRVKDDNGALFAAKYLSPENLSSEKKKRFQNELAFCSKSEHPNVVRVLDWGLVEVRGAQCPFYVMPLYSSSLRALLKNRIPPGEVMTLFAQVLDGVEAAHLLDVCHRDLKPENVLCQEEERLLVVADFGIARFAEPLMRTAVETKPSSRLANFQYAAPEQIEKDQDIDRRADIYALGLMLNEMFTGRIPHGQGYAQVGSVSSEHAYLDDLVRAMLMQDPNDRPQSIAEIKRELIARGESAAREQRLSTLRHKVVPKTEVDDPLVLEPPEITGARWNPDELVMTLSRPVNAAWAQCFHNPGDHTSVLGHGPETFEISGSVVKARCEGDLAKRLLNFAKDYVNKANAKYRLTVEQSVQQRQAREEAELKRHIVEEEKARAINDSLTV